MSTVAVALLFIALGTWIIATAPASSRWGTRANRWQFRLLMGGERYCKREEGLERYFGRLAVANLWFTRIVGAFFLIVGIGALVELRLR